MTCPSIGPKLFWTVQICFHWVQILLFGSKLFWMDPNDFGKVQIIFFWTYDLDPTKITWTLPELMIGTQPKLFRRSKIVLDR
jgi:hypothetical protein